MFSQMDAKSKLIEIEIRFNIFFIIHSFYPTENKQYFEFLLIYDSMSTEELV